MIIINNNNMGSSIIIIMNNNNYYYYYYYKRHDSWPLQIAARYLKAWMKTTHVSNSCRLCRSAYTSK